MRGKAQIGSTEAARRRAHEEETSRIDKLLPGTVSLHLAGDCRGTGTEIVPDTPKIYCAFKTQGAKSGTPVRGAWIAVDVGDIMPPNYKIAEATLTLTDTIHNGMFNVSEPNTGFPVGKYRVEIYVGDDLAKTIPFTVKAK